MLLLSLLHLQETAIDYHKVKKDVKETTEKAKQRAKEDTAKVAAAAKDASAKAAEKAKEAGGAGVADVLFMCCCCCRLYDHCLQQPRRPAPRRLRRPRKQVRSEAVIDKICLYAVATTTLQQAQ